MKLTATVFFSLLLSFAVVTAQDNGPNVESGNLALTFQVNGFGTFGLTGDLAGSTTTSPFNVPGLDSIIGELFGGIAFPIYGIGIKAFVSDNFAIRGALGLNYTGTTSRTPGSGGSTIEQTDDKFVVAIAPGFEYHFVDAGPVSGYIGGIVSYSSGVATTGPDTAQSSMSNSTLFIGAMLGGEIFPWDNFSLGAEYFLGFRSTSTSSDVGDQSFDGDSYLNIGTGNFAVKANLYIK